MVNERKSNFELMRIISMYMIVLWHLIEQVQSLSNGAVKVILIFLQSLIVVHVNSFVLLCGFFQYKKKFRVSKFLKLYNEVWFYKCLIPIICCLVGVCSLDLVFMIKSVSPIYYGDYWYVSVYFVLLAISPILNIVIKNVDKKKHFKIIVLLLIFFSVFPTITRQTSFENNRGLSLTNFILLYFIGSYFGKYSIDKSYIFSKFKSNARKIMFFSGYVSFAILISIIHIFALHINLGMGKVIQDISSTMVASFGCYDNTFVILESICYFLFFSSLSFSSKFINKISKYIFAVYLIHYNPSVILWFFDFVGSTRAYKNPIIIFRFLGLAFIIIVICVFIEIIRQFIFKVIGKMKISKKIRNGFKNYIYSLGVEINW